MNDPVIPGTGAPSVKLIGPTNPPLRSIVTGTLTVSPGRSVATGCDTEKSPATVIETVPTLFSPGDRPPEALNVVRFVPSGAAAAAVSTSVTRFPVVLAGMNDPVTPGTGAPSVKLIGPTNPPLRSIVTG